MIFTEIEALDSIIERVRGYLPPTLFYIKIISNNVGWQQYSMDMYFYDENWKEVIFTESGEFEDETCVEDFINNSLIGGTDFGVDLPYFEFFPDREYFYKIK